MKLLFWNTYRNKKINPYIEGIVADYDVDMLVLSEYLADKNELSIALAEGGQQLVDRKSARPPVLNCKRKMNKI